MKLKNILSIAFFLFIAVSCSMEDQVLNDLNNTGKSNANSTLTNGEVTLSFKLNTPADFATKAEDRLATADEDMIRNLSLILLDKNDDIVKVYDNVYLTNGIAVKTKDGNDTIKFVGKESDVLGWRILAVANSGESFSSGYATLDNVKNKVLENVQALPKMGISKALTAENYDVYGSIDAARANKPVILDIELMQLAARIDIGKFTFQNFTGSLEKYDVYIDSVKAVDLYQHTYLSDSEYLSGEYASKKYEYNNGLKVFDASENNLGYSFVWTAEDDQPVWYSFMNKHASLTPVAVIVYYRIGNENTTRMSNPLVVNQGVVEQGKLYRLEITMKNISTLETEFDVICYTNDWIPNTLPGLDF